ncbi:hypothetical protein SLS60_006925 [Paraconiothyrium brasiliense]|uniref:Heterokaryon incompatibility domain-containing protein n=1 Tax=Paraconiothyrium brasiliense TaxID=300254 RepID=A0ABR3R8R4_9PLEO
MPPKAGSEKQEACGTLSMPTAFKAGKLCKFCQRIDFLSYFTSNPPKKTQLCTLTHTESCRSCVVCSIFHGLNTPALEGKARGKATIEVQQRVLEREEYLRTTDTAPVYVLSFVVKHAKKEIVWSQGFDLCGGHPEHGVAHPAMNTEWRMVRRALKSLFKADLVAEWLRSDEVQWEDWNLEVTSGASEASEVEQSIESGSSSVLAALISKGQFRVIDVWTGDVIAVRSTLRYLALSYVWGRPQDQKQYLIPSAEKAEDIAWKIDLTALPRTLEDTVLLVRELGEAYIWIDSLCIDQSSTNDKAAIVPAMDGIYSNAYLTIIAANGPNADAGLAGFRTGRSVPDTPIGFEQHGRTLSLIPSRPGYAQILEEATWSSRGWTYQEHVLSSRCIFFTASEVLFAGDAGAHEREAFSLERTLRQSSNSNSNSIRRTGKQLTTRDFLLRRRNHDFDGLSMWMRYKTAVEAFSSRSLTNAGDRFDAFNGVLNYLAAGHRRRDEVRVLSGLMYFSVRDRGDGYILDNFVQALLWRPRPRSCTPHNRIPLNATGTSALPSWSWAGWLVPVDVEDTDTWSGWELRFSEMVPHIVNENNIQCHDSTGEDAARWPFEPEVCKISPLEGLVLHLWVPVLNCVLRRDPNRQREEGFNIYYNYVKWDRHGSHGVSDVDGKTDKSMPPSVTLIRAGQIEIHDGFLPSITSNKRTPETEQGLSSVTGAHDLTAELHVQMLLFCRKKNLMKVSPMIRRARMMLVRSVGGFKERVALSEYCECHELVFNNADDYRHVKLI